MEINILPSHLQFCDFTKFGSSKNDNKKKMAKNAISEIVSSYRCNILHLAPLFETRKTNEQYSPLVCSDSYELDLSETVSKCLSLSEVNTLEETTSQIYMLGTNKENKLMLLRIKFSHSDSDFKTELVESAEIVGCSLEEQYTITSHAEKVAVVGRNKIVVCNSSKLSEQYSTTNENLSEQTVLDVISKTTLKPLPNTNDATEGKNITEEQKESSEKESKETQQEAQEEIKQQDITVDLLKEGDCDLTELDQIFKSKPIVLRDIRSGSRQENDGSVESQIEFAKTRNLHKLKLKLYFKSKQNLTRDRRSFDMNKIQYIVKEDQNVYEKPKLLQLKVHSNTGSQINPSCPPSLMIDKSSSESYISNYPRPTIIFTHHKEQKFLPVQFTVGSKIHREKSNADSFPIGAGLVFCANSLQALTFTRKYYDLQCHGSYSKWLTDRLSMKLPLKE